MLFRVIDTQYLELIIISLSLFIYLQSVYRVFFIYDILVCIQNEREHVDT